MKTNHQNCQFSESSVNLARIRLSVKGLTRAVVFNFVPGGPQLCIFCMAP